MITRSEGRIGEDSEYIEHTLSENPDGPRLVAQRGTGRCWYVFAVEPGREGRVVTLAYFSPSDKEIADTCALVAAKVYELAARKEPDVHVHR